jgi:hypothetical protein
VRHSRSGDPGETVTVAVTVGGGIVRVEVTHAGSWRGAASDELSDEDRE